MRNEQPRYWIFTETPSLVANLTLTGCKAGLADRIAQVRGDRSQRQFARDLGVFQQNVNRYESGTTPHVDFLLILALRENVSLDWLLLGTGTMRRRKVSSRRTL